MTDINHSGILLGTSDDTQKELAINCDIKNLSTISSPTASTRRRKSTGSFDVGCIPNEGTPGPPLLSLKIEEKLNVESELLEIISPLRNIPASTWDSFDASSGFSFDTKNKPKDKYVQSTETIVENDLVGKRRSSHHNILSSNRKKVSPEFTRARPSTASAVRGTFNSQTYKSGIRDYKHTKEEKVPTSVEELTHKKDNIHERKSDTEVVNNQVNEVVASPIKVKKKPENSAVWMRNGLYSLLVRFTSTK
jgi:hypothetical protein